MTSKLNHIYKALTDLGLRKAQVRALMPDWWDDDAAKSELGVWEFVMLVSRRLSLDAKSLAEGHIRPIGSVTEVAYKHRKTNSDDQYVASSMIAASLAEAIVAATLKPFKAFGLEAASIRAAIRDENDGIVDFDGLVSFCWDSGIPIIPLPHLPIGIRKMDGAIFRLAERPAIIISRKNDSRSWLNFILAHELGHYCLGHLEHATSIIDADLKGAVEIESESPSDLQEAEADKFALDLLGGTEAERVISTWSPRMDGVSMAAEATVSSHRAGSSPGHLVLRHAFKSKRWPEAQTALKFLNEDFEAQRHLVQTLGQNIDLGRIAGDLQELVMDVTGLTDAQS